MTTTVPLVTGGGPGGARRRPLLCALGDSISSGVGDRVGGAPRSGLVGLADEPDAGWCRHLATLLGADLLNLGRSGARALDVQRHQLPAALAAAPDLATVLVGGNDVLRGDHDAEQVRAALHASVGALLAGGTEVVLVVPPMLGPELPVPAAARRVLGRRMSQVRAVTVDVAGSLAHPRLTVVDADPVRAHGPGVLHIDRIHPSPAGHRLLARHVHGDLARRGWPTVAAVHPAPPPPGAALQAAWLLVRGAPWLARRSRDLLPELVRLVAQEEVARRRRPGVRAAVGAVSAPERLEVAGDGGVRDGIPPAGERMRTTCCAEPVTAGGVGEQG